MHGLGTMQILGLICPLFFLLVQRPVPSPNTKLYYLSVGVLSHQFPSAVNDHVSCLFSILVLNNM